MTLKTRNLLASFGLVFFVLVSILVPELKSITAHLFAVLLLSILVLLGFVSPLLRFLCIISARLEGKATPSFKFPHEGSARWKAVTMWLVGVDRNGKILP
ncbi:hypothetical protein Q4555_06670 [Octadecabacter sp. 1_MG-2023]|uniref:hypothetical protein n=1 Tax=unclassified Octadecabacter TaxID=196158 RepID=UPI001C08512D|nr:MULTISPECIES: hypothetical protein [unclassified Octadecabacter]MBU2994367.1 hypothetical protein [Octadecabacter sp. B2R22]MDO6734344.1 hypothetical protein [Octadecabacter sp. 1_MG-2023]